MRQQSTVNSRQSNDQAAIRVEGISKVFKLPHEKHTSVKSAFINFYRRKRGYEMQEALQNVSFEVKKGEFFGIVGRNGSGKSTLLKLLAGIYVPTKGNIEINGSLTPFIELGVGFNPELTGRENVFLNGALLGFNRKEMRALYKDIVEFAELEKFMDQKLKNYSSGMQVRLAFSIAIQSKSDILLVDEVLAVGDISFQQKCYEIFRQLKNNPTTIVFVSHDLRSVEEFCDRVALVDSGQIVSISKPTDAVVKYKTIMSGDAESKGQDTEQLGTGEVVISGINLLSENKKVSQLAEGSPLSIQIIYNAKKKIVSPVFGLAVVDKAGNVVTGPNTKEAGVSLGSIKGRGKITANFSRNPLSPGHYTFTVSCFNENLTIPYAFVKNLGSVQIIGEERHGIINLEPSWSADSKHS